MNFLNSPMSLMNFKIMQQPWLLNSKLSKMKQMESVFFILNNIVFGRQLTTKIIRDEICNFLLKMKIYKHIREGDLDYHLIRRERYWDTNLELRAFSDLIRLSIYIYTSLDQDALEL